MMLVIEKYAPREYTAFSHDGGVVLCDRQTGAFLVLRFAEDLERLKTLLDTVTVLPRQSREGRIAQLEAERDALLAEAA
jgi:hypothetical protein